MLEAVARQRLAAEQVFVVASGRPMSMRWDVRTRRATTSRLLVDLKWPRAAAMTRKTIAESLTAVIPQLFARTKGKPEDRLIRTALRCWAFDTSARQDEAMPARSAGVRVSTPRRPSHR